MYAPCPIIRVRIRALLHVCSVVKDRYGIDIYSTVLQGKYLLLWGLPKHVGLGLVSGWGCRVKAFIARQNSSDGVDTSART